MTIRKGDWVRPSSGGPQMQVLAVSLSLVICERIVDGKPTHEVFGRSELVPAGGGQQAQQPQPTSPPAE